MRADADGHVTAPWLTAPESRAVLAALTAGGWPARFVGGCVRDALIDPGRDVADLDLATPERPERVIELMRAAGIRVVPTGLKHGTVTAFLGRHVFEITTLRRDVACDGRHAEVEFTDDFAADAARRDFTINAMSCDAAGRLFDPFGGAADLRAGRIRFVGDARRRITEDYLRIIRFFRFFARFGRPPADAEALAACAAEAAGIDRLSGERVSEELLRLLIAAGAATALELMRETGVLAHIVPWPIEVAPLVRLAAAWPDADPLLRLAALTRGAGPSPADIERLAMRLRLSNAERDRLGRLLLSDLPDVTGTPATRRRQMFELGAETYTDLVRLAHALGAADRAAAESALAHAAQWRPPAFPLRGDDLIARGIAPGPELGHLLAQVREAWVASDFSLDRDACLRRLDELIAAARPRP